MGERHSVALGLLALLALGVLEAACVQREPVTGIYDCPLLIVGEGAGRVTYGGVASVGRFRDGACIEIFASGTRVAHTYVGPGGTFAVQFVVQGDAAGAEFTLRAIHESSGLTETLPLAFTSQTRAEITYAATTTPLLMAGGRLRFSGWLEPVGDLSPIRDAWMVNWTSGAVAPVSPTPGLGTPFVADVEGSRSDSAAILSRHVGGGRGGCWWPAGGGGIAPFCTLEEFRAGTCVGGTCAGGRGCTPIDVDERRSPAPAAETDRAIPVLPPEPDPPDAGPPDAPPVDPDAEPF